MVRALKQSQGEIQQGRHGGGEGRHQAPTSSTREKVEAYKYHYGEKTRRRTLPIPFEQVTIAQPEFRM